MSKQLTIIDFTDDEKEFIEKKVKRFNKFLVNIRIMAEEAFNTEQQAIKQFGKLRGGKIFKEIGIEVKKDWEYIRELKYIPQKVYPSLAKVGTSANSLDKVGFTNFKELGKSKTEIIDAVIVDIKDDLNKEPEKITKKYMKERIKKAKYKQKHKNQPKPTKSKFKLLNEDIFKTKFNGQKFDLIYIDPPYNILKEKWDTFESKQKYKEFTEKWIKAILPKLKDTGRLYVSFSQWFMYDFKNWMKPFCKEFDLIFSNMIIWNYKNNMKPHNKRLYKYTYEPIFYYRKKNAPELIDKEKFGEERLDVWTIATPQSNYNGDQKVHPAQKPLEMMKRIIETGCPADGWVLDPFAGSGTTGIVCKETNHNFILIENNKKYFEIMQKRIKNGTI